MITDAWCKPLFAKQGGSFLGPQLGPFTAPFFLQCKPLFPCALVFQCASTVAVMEDWSSDPGPDWVPSHLPDPDSDSESDSSSSSSSSSFGESLGVNQCRPPTTRRLTGSLPLGSRTHISGDEDEEEEATICAAQRVRMVAAAKFLLGPDDRGANKEAAGFSWSEHVKGMSDRDFKLRYRMACMNFYELLERLEPELKRTNPKQAVRVRSGKPIELPTRLACALRYFAGGDPLDLLLIYDMSKKQVMNCVWDVVDAVNACLDNISFPIHDVQKLAALEADFAAGTRGGFWRGQVGAIDGCHFKMKALSSKDASDPIRYHVARKDTYAMLCIAICDYHRRFTFVDFSHAPCTHDSTAWSATKLGAQVNNGELPTPFFLNGDAAFCLGPSMITPSNNDPLLDDYDFYQSSNRMAIECAFGILHQRWGVLWRPLCCAFLRRAPLITALMRLHNFCIDKRLVAEGDMPDVQQPIAEVQPNRFSVPPKFDKDGRPVEHLDVSRNSDNLEGMPTRAQRAGCKSGRRDQLAAAVHESGYRRAHVLPGVVRKVAQPKGGKKGKRTATAKPAAAKPAAAKPAAAKPTVAKPTAAKPATTSANPPVDELFALLESKRKRTQETAAMKVAVAQRMAQEMDTGVRVNVEYAAALAKRRNSDSQPSDSELELSADDDEI